MTPLHFANYHSESDAPWLELRDSAMVELLYGSGLRVGELIGLDSIGTAQSLGWVDMNAAEVHVLGKGGKRRTVPVGSKALQALGLWVRARGRSHHQ
jgi:integrase/recombinase XerC